MNRLLLTLVTLISVGSLRSMETTQDDNAKKTLREKIKILVDLRQCASQNRKQILTVAEIKETASDFQIYQILSTLENNNELYLPRDLIQLITLYARGMDSLQKIFDDYECCGDRSNSFDNPYSYLVECLEAKSNRKLEKFFDYLPNKESTLKMALRMVYEARSRCHLKTHLDFFHSGLRGNDTVNILRDDYFDGQLQKYLKDFLALLQPTTGNYITTLRIHGCKLSALPKTLGWLKELWRISLSKNNFMEVPKIISQCKQLEHLHLDHNQICELPPWLVECGWKRLNITIDKDVVIPWNEKDYPNICIIRYGGLSSFL